MLTNAIWCYRINRDSSHDWCHLSPKVSKIEAQYIAYRTLLDQSDTNSTIAIKRWFIKLFAWDLIKNWDNNCVDGCSEIASQFVIPYIGKLVPTFFQTTFSQISRQIQIPHLKKNRINPVPHPHLLNQLNTECASLQCSDFDAIDEMNWMIWGFIDKIFLVSFFHKRAVSIYCLYENHRHALVRKGMSQDWPRNLKGTLKVCVLLLDNCGTKSITGNCTSLRM